MAAAGGRSLHRVGEVSRRCSVFREREGGGCVICAERRHVAGTRARRRKEDRSPIDTAFRSAAARLRMDDGGSGKFRLAHESVIVSTQRDPLTHLRVSSWVFRPRLSPLFAVHQ